MGIVNYNLYKIGSTEILVGSRPDRVEMTPEFESSIDGWLSITESHVLHKSPGLRQWCPWNENGKPTPECLFSSIKTLYEWVEYAKFKRIYVHCDAGTHRAPTIFGMFLMAYYPDQAEEICSNFIPVERGPYTKNPSDPIVYAKTYIDELNWIRDLLPLIKKAESLDTWVDLVPKKVLAKYRWEREIKINLPLLLHVLKYQIFLFIKYDLFYTPIRRVSDFFHKRLNTKRGQWLKKMGW